jgi:putative copper export protein
MRALYLASVALHILAAALWVGGMLFFVTVVLPALSHPSLRPSRSRIIEYVGRAFRPVAWIALATLLVTGTFNLFYRWTDWNSIITGNFWHTPIGNLFGWKVVLVIAMVALHALHDFWLGPRAAEALERGENSAATLRCHASWAGRLVMIISIAVVVLAVTFVRGC